MWRFWLVVVLWAAIVAERSAALGIPVRDPEGQMFRNRLAKALVFLVVIALVEGVVRAAVARLVAAQRRPGAARAVDRAARGPGGQRAGRLPPRLPRLPQPQELERLQPAARRRPAGPRPGAVPRAQPLGDAAHPARRVLRRRGAGRRLPLLHLRDRAGPGRQPGADPPASGRPTSSSAPRRGPGSSARSATTCCRAWAPTPRSPASSPACGTPRSPTPRPSTSSSAPRSWPTPRRPTRSSAWARSPASTSASPRWSS